MEKIYHEASLKAGVYKLTNKIDGKFYYGSCKRFKQRWREHENRLNRNKHENQKLQNAFNKHGSRAFVFEVVVIVDSEDRSVRLNLEEMCINENWGDGSQCYNLKKTTNQVLGPWSNTPEETKKLISAKLTGRKVSAETRKKISDSTMGRKCSDETLLLLSESHKGRKHTEEQKQKISIALKGKQKTTEHRQNVSKNWYKRAPMSDETRQKLSNSHKGKQLTEEQKQKISISLKGREQTAEHKQNIVKNWHKRSPMSDETKQKISDGHKGKPGALKGRKWTEAAIEARKSMLVKKAIIKLAQLFNQERLSELEQYYENFNQTIKSSH